MTTPTDLEILNAIFKMYYQDYISYTKEAPNRAAKILVPIDNKKIAKHLGSEPDIIFGRLYYHLEQKYGYSRDNAKIHFFALKAGDDIHCINFPYMVSVLADLKHENKKYWLSTTISIIALTVSFVAVTVSVFI